MRLGCDGPCLPWSLAGRDARDDELRRALTASAGGDRKCALCREMSLLQRRHRPSLRPLHREHRHLSTGARRLRRPLASARCSGSWANIRRVRLVCSSWIMRPKQQWLAVVRAGAYVSGTAVSSQRRTTLLRHERLRSASVSPPLEPVTALAAGGRKGPPCHRSARFGSHGCHGAIFRLDRSDVPRGAGLGAGLPGLAPDAGRGSC